MADFAFHDVIEVRGHIIDSNILGAIMTEVMDRGGEFELLALEPGRARDDPSYARLEIRAPSRESLATLLARVGALGATPVHATPAQIALAPADGVFPDDFYSTTNLQTRVFVDGSWLPVQYPEMDCAITVRNGRARCITMNEVRGGDPIVVGHDGVRVLPLERPRHQPPVFAFMGSNVSSGKPNPRLIRQSAT